MAGQVQLAFLLVIAAFTHSDAAPLADEQSPPSIEPLDYSVVLDDQFDQQLPYLHSFILHNGMDPMNIVDISESLLPDLPGIFKGHIDLTQGWVQNLSKVKRAGHVIAKYTSDKQLIFDMELGCDLMTSNYRYDIKYLLLHRTGDLFVRLSNLKTKAMVTVDMIKYHISLDYITFTDVGELDVKFEGHLLDTVLNLATKVVTTVFKDVVLKHVEQRTMQIISAKLEEWNELISHPNSTKLNMNIDTFDIKMNGVGL